MKDANWKVFSADRPIHAGESQGEYSIIHRKYPVSKN